MKTLNLYIAKQLVTTTAIAVGVLTFVMLSANLVKVFGLLSRGVSAGLLCRFLMFQMPDILTFALPLALLCSAVLVFSRLSAENEITAMRASGISLWQIISPGLILSILLSALCLWLQTTVSPRCRYQAYQLRTHEGIKNPMVAIEAGRFVELPGYVIRVGERQGDQLTDVHIYALGANGEVRQDITARRGTVVLHEHRRVLEIVLGDATIAAIGVSNDQSEKEVQRFASKTFTFPLHYGTELDHRTLTRKLKYLDVSMIFGRIYIESAWGNSTTPHYVELHTRLSMALSPFAFLLLGIPFGVHTRRSETSVGLLLSMILAVGFYSFIMVADGLKHQSSLHPELLVWVPNIVYQIGGLCALSTIAKR